MSKKKNNGEVFTPENVINYMVENNYLPNEMEYVLEPGCGDGRFIIKIIKEIVKYYKNDFEIINEKINKIYGIELDVENYNKTITNIKNFLINYPLITESPKIINGDALLDLPNNIEWSFIVGNPPYIRIHNLPKSYLTTLQKNYIYLQKGMVDLYYGFFELHKKLSKNGVLCFITPSSYLYNSSGQFLVNDLYKHRLFKKIEDFESTKMFDDASTYTCVTTLSKKNPHFNYQIVDSEFRIQENTKVSYDKDCFSLSRIKQKSGSKDKLFSTKYKVRTGFATLADKVFIINEYQDNGETIGFQKNGVVHNIEKDITKKCVKASKYNGNFNLVIFPYKNVDGKNIPLTEIELRNDFPLGYSYLLGNQQKLLSRDKGKIDKDKWYLWGRTQGINNTKGSKIIISPMFITTPFTFINEDVLVYSGYYIITESYDDLFTNLNFIDSLKSISKPMAQGWKSIQKKIIDEVII